VTESVDIIYISRMRKRTEQNLFVRIGKSEAKVTNNKRVIMQSRYCAGDRARGLYAIAEHLVFSYKIERKPGTYQSFL